MLEMLGFLRNLKGNPKTVLALDPLWTAPFNMYMPFATLFMFALGLGDIEIGLLLSIGMFANFLMALLSGVVTDKFGRKKTLLIGDFLAWSMPVLIWSLSQNFWWFLVAALFNSVSHIGQVAFECSWLDDIEDEKIQKMAFWFHILWHCAVFSALISAFFVERYELIPVVRTLYAFAFVIMTARLVFLWFFLKETERGKERMEATRDSSITKLLFEYKDVFLQILRSSGMRRVLVLLLVMSIFQMVAGTFFALYVTQDLGLGDYILAYFPAVRSVISLFFYFFIQNRLERFKIQHLMGAGLALYVAGHVLLIAAPPQNLLWLGAYALMDAWAAALFLPRLDNVIFSSIDATERARCRALINVVVLAITSPFGILAGVMSDMDRRIPFMFNIVLFLCLIFFLLRKQQNTEVSS